MKLFDMNNAVLTDDAQKDDFRDPYATLRQAKLE